MLSLVVAMSVPGRIIGRAGDLPWRYPEDLKHFRRVTEGGTVAMGRKTYESIGKPLAKRRNVVLTRDPAWRPDHDEVEALRLSGDAALDELLRAWRAAPEEIFLIGGGEIFRAGLPHADRIHLTEVRRAVEGDAVFPDFDRDDWREAERRQGETPELTFLRLDRARAAKG